jgi:hypothetical protein
MIVTDLTTDSAGYVLEVACPFCGKITMLKEAKK